MSQDPGSEQQGGDPGQGEFSSRSPGSVHWLTRVAERAGLTRGEALDVPPGTQAREAWPVVVRAFSISEQRLAELVAEYFRLEVADFRDTEPNVVLLIPEAMARKHHIFPLQESDRYLVVATCDPTDVEAERALGFSTGRTAVFNAASPQSIQEALDDRFAPEKTVETLLGSLESEMDEADSAVKMVEDMGSGTHLYGRCSVYSGGQADQPDPARRHCPGGQRHSHRAGPPHGFDPLPGRRCVA